jgi:hypothetical protein
MTELELKQKELINKLYQWSELHCEADLTRNDCEGIVSKLAEEIAALEAKAKPIHFQTDEEIDDKVIELADKYYQGDAIPTDFECMGRAVAKWMRDEIKKQLE